VGREDCVGERVHAVFAGTFGWSVEALGQLSPEMLAALDTDSGEHLAAIVTTAFLGTVPSSVDIGGEVDLCFRPAPGTHAAEIVGCSGDRPEAAFEVKSMPGGFREFFNRREGEIGDSTFVTVISVADVLAVGREQLRRAAEALRRKTDGTQSRNIVLLVHILEYPAAEQFSEQFVSFLLVDPGDEFDDIESIWLILYPSHAVRWEKSLGRWVNLLSAGSVHHDGDVSDPLDEVLTESEARFCELYRDGRQTPWSVHPGVME
jgi:hypothetical protein